MHRPTLRQLEYVVAIADHGSFGAAARACHVTQPGLSSQIQQVEHLLGATLFERDRRKVLVTRVGEEIVARARDVLLRVDHMVEASEALERPFSGEIALGVIPTVAPYLLPEVLPRARVRYPDLRFRLHEGQTHELLALLDRGELDLLLLALEADLGNVATASLFEDPFVLAVPEGHRLAKRRSVTEGGLAGEPMLLLTDGHCLRDQALSLCTQAGVREASDFRASSLPTLVQMVAGGAGMTLLPSLSLAVEGKTPGISVVRFRKPAPHRTIGVAWRPSSPRAGEFEELGAALTP